MKTKGLTTFITAVASSVVVLLAMVLWNEFYPVQSQATVFHSPSVMAQDTYQPVVEISGTTTITPEEIVGGQVKTYITLSVDDDPIDEPAVGAEDDLYVLVNGKIAETFKGIGALTPTETMSSETGLAFLTLNEVDGADEWNNYGYTLEFTYFEAGEGFAIEWDSSVYDSVYKLATEPTTPKVTTGLAAETTNGVWCGTTFATTPTLTVTEPDPDKIVRVEDPKITVTDHDGTELAKPYDLTKFNSVGNYTITVALLGDVTDIYGAGQSVDPIDEVETTFKVTEGTDAECGTVLTTTYALDLKVEPSSLTVLKNAEVTATLVDQDGKTVADKDTDIDFTVENIEKDGKSYPFAAIKDADKGQGGDNDTNDTEGMTKGGVLTTTLKALLAPGGTITATATVDGEKIEGTAEVAVALGTGNKEAAIGMFENGVACVFGTGICLKHGGSTAVAQTIDGWVDDSLLFVTLDTSPIEGSPQTVAGNEDQFVPTSSPASKPSGAEWAMANLFMNITIVEPDADVVIGTLKSLTYTISLDRTSLGEFPTDIQMAFGAIISNTKTIRPSEQLTINNTDVETPTWELAMESAPCTNSVCSSTSEGTLFSTTLNYVPEEDFGFVMEQRAIYLPIVRKPAAAK